MKQYKLIKEYPGSPGLGTIVKHEKNNFCYSFIKDNIRNLFVTNEIESYPEFWQEIVEKDYEILEFRLINHLLPEKPLCKIIDGKYFTPDGIEMPKTDLDEMEITKVKRLSDGEIFEIGNKVYCDEFKFRFEIKSFKILKNTLYVCNKLYYALNIIEHELILDPSYVEKHNFKPLFNKNWTDQNMIAFAEEAINNLTKRGIFDKELDKLSQQLENFKKKLLT